MSEELVDARPSLGRVHTRALVGLKAPAVDVEVHLGGGLPGFSIVGLPAAAVRESKDRVRSALTNCGVTVPRRQIIVNLSPADMPKEGGRFDLPIAIGLMAAAGLLSSAAVRTLATLELVGELALGGRMLPIRGALPTALGCDESRALVVPEANGPESALAPCCRVLACGHLLDLVAHLEGRQALEAALPMPLRPVDGQPDLADVRGQNGARRALEVAAAGGHNLLMMGPPGTGKTMLAHRLPGLLPPLTGAEAADVATVQSISNGGFSAKTFGQRPFRAPHHTASYVAMVGGGAHARPGELSLAHLGVLFLDELPEFDRRVLECLREPLEAGRIGISRAAYKVELPANVQLVAAMNPCHCGYLGDGTARCQCAPTQVARYRGRVSGPLLDRIDMHVSVPQQALATLRTAPAGEPSATVRARVAAARAVQMQRGGLLNAGLDGRGVSCHCALADAESELLEKAAERLALSARASHRVLKVARTIADLDGHGQILDRHLLEAIGYRTLERAS